MNQSFPVEKSQSAKPNTTLATPTPRRVIKRVQSNAHITIPPRPAPRKIPNHQDLEDSKSPEPRNILPQIRNTIKENQISRISLGASGRVTASHRNNGAITSSAEPNHSKYASF